MGKKNRGKQAAAAAEPDPVSGLIDEATAFNQAAAHPEARRLMQSFLDNGGQTVEVERGGLDDLLVMLNRA